MKFDTLNRLQNRVIVNAQLAAQGRHLSEAYTILTDTAIRAIINKCVKYTEYKGIGTEISLDIYIFEPKEIFELLHTDFEQGLKSQDGRFEMQRERDER